VGRPNLGATAAVDDTVDGEGASAIKGPGATMPEIGVAGDARGQDALNPARRRQLVTRHIEPTPVIGIEDIVEPGQNDRREVGAGDPPDRFVLEWTPMRRGSPTAFSRLSKKPY
jgi:hypothetical protein